MEIRSSCALVLILVACGSSDSPSTVTVTETIPAGEEGDVVITLHREGGSGALAIPFTTREESATGDADFALAAGEVIWEDDDMSDKTITVTLLDDVTIEPAESFVVEIGEPSNDSTIDKSNVSVTITDDDHPGDSYAVTSAGRLMHFDRAQPGRFTWATEITGLPAGETIIAIDMRPADGMLYGLSSAAKLYTIDPLGGAATATSTLTADASDTSSPFTGLSGDVGIDFNPITDRLRVTSTTGQNLRVDVDTGAVITDPAISGQSTGYTAIAHNNNIAAACRTRLYAIDAVANRFVTQSDDGTTQGAGGLRLTPTASGGFDMYTDADGKSTAHAVLTVDGASGMYKIDLGTGKAEVVRAKVSPLAEGELVRSFAFTPLPASVPATQQFGDLFGVTSSAIVSFNRVDTEKLCTTKPLTGLEPGETVLDLDMRPSNGSLYVLTKIGSAGKLRRVDPYSGNLTPAVPIDIALAGSAFGIDFSPPGNVPLRIVSDAGQNIRVTDLETGASTADAALNGSATGAAYTDSVMGAGTAALYVIDPATDRLAIQNPSTGTLTDVGPLGVNITTLAGFDIDGRNNVGFLASTVGGTSQLRSVNLATGASASLGTVGTSSPLLGIARATPDVNLYGVTTDGKLVRISITDPSNVTVVSDPMLMPPTDKITGLAPSEYLIGIDFRPGQNMYGLTNFGAIYSVNSSTAATGKQGVLTADPMDTSSPYSALAGTAFDIDFDPTGDLPMRIVSDAEQNLRIPSFTPPRVFTDAPLSAPTAVDIAGSAYTNSYPGATSTALYAVCATSGELLIQSPPNSGSLSIVGPLGVAGKLAGFDIAGGNNGIALASLQLPGETFNRLYRVNLATGAATQIGNGIAGAPLRSIAVQIR